MVTSAQDLSIDSNRSSSSISSRLVLSSRVGSTPRSTLGNNHMEVETGQDFEPSGFLQSLAVRGTAKPWGLPLAGHPEKHQAHC